MKSEYDPMKTFINDMKTQLTDAFRPLWRWAADRPPLTIGHKWLAIWLISFLAWVMETVYCSALAGELVDRGLLILPLCPLYGISLGVIDALIGTPREGGLMLHRCRPGLKRLILYFCLATLIPTVAEFLTGLFFDGLLGVRLWYYETQPFTLMGYVCLQVSLLWGVMLTAYMFFVHPFIQKIVSLVPRRPAAVLAIIISALVIANLVFFFVRFLG